MRLEILRGRDFTCSAYLVPDIAANVVQRVGREHDDVKRVDTTYRVGEAVGDRSGDPRRHVAGHQLDLFAAFFAEFVEEPLDGLAVTAGRGPNQPAAVVIDDDGQVALALAMRYLVDADPPEPVEQIDFASRFLTHTFADTADRPLRDLHQLGHRGLRRVDGKPRRLVFKRPREPRPMTRRRDRADYDAMAATAHPRRIGFDERKRRSEIQRTPPPPPFTEIEPRAAPPSHAAAISLAPARPGHNDDLSFTANLHVLHDRPLDAQQPRPYPGSAHAVRPLGFQPSRSRNLGTARRAPLISRSPHPREQQEHRVSPRRQGARARAVRHLLSTHPARLSLPYGHTHREQEEVYVVVRRSGRMKLDAAVVELEEWDVVCVPPGTWRGYEGGLEGLEILVFGAPSLGENARYDVTGQRDWWAD